MKVVLRTINTLVIVPSLLHISLILVEANRKELTKYPSTSVEALSPLFSRKDSSRNSGTIF